MRVSHRVTYVAYDTKSQSRYAVIADVFYANFIIICESGNAYHYLYMYYRCICSVSIVKAHILVLGLTIDPLPYEDFRTL